jgi:hypothetical protein
MSAVSDKELSEEQLNDLKTQIENLTKEEIQLPTNIFTKMEVYTKMSGYDYAYIDDNGVLGSVGLLKEANGKLVSFESLDDAPDNVSYTKRIKTDCQGKPFVVNDELLLQTFDLNKTIPIGYDPECKTDYDIFEANKNMRICYLVENQRIIGAVYAKNDSDADVYISSVYIESDKQGEKLCDPMIRLFILNANLSSKKHLSFHLKNTGGPRSFTCYMNAFTKCGYEAYWEHIDKSKGTGIQKFPSDKAGFLQEYNRINSDIGIQNVLIRFIYKNGIEASGGKRKRIRAKKTNTKKAKRTKTTKKTRTTRKTRKSKQTRRYTYSPDRED